MVSADEVCAALGIDQSTLWRWWNSGYFPPPLIMGTGEGIRTKIAWFEDDIDAWQAVLQRKVPTDATWSAEDQPCFTSADLNEHLEILLKLARSCFDCGEDEEKRSYWGAALADLEESFTKSRASE
jgi:predicted DNA-binding transcriptional regulator AlpA